MNNSGTAKLITILDYIGILCLLGLFIEKDNPDVRFHTNQGLILLLTDVVVGVACGILTVLGGFIPLVGFVFRLAASLLSLCLFILMIVGIVNAAQGQCRPLPVIGGLFRFIH
jgi:hypothetical protein